MDDKLHEFIGSAYQEGMPINGKVHYAFTCYACGKKIITQNTYAAGTGGVVKEAIQSSARSGLANLFYNIPVVGRILYQVVSSAMSNTTYEQQQKRESQGKQDAYNEISSQFSRCSQCGIYACSSCFSNGLCKNCRANAAMQQRHTNTQANNSGNSQGGAKDPTKMWE